MTCNFSSDAAGAHVSRQNGRLLIVSPYFGEHGGGVERVAQKMSEGLAARGWDVIWSASAEAAEAESFAASRLRLVRLPIAAWNAVERAAGIPFPVWGPRGLARVWAAVGKVDAVVVHESLYIPSMLTAFVARLRGKPMVLVQHVGAVPYRSALARGLMALGNLSWSRAIHAMAYRKVYISQTVMRYFKEDVSGGACSLIPNGVDLECFQSRPGNAMADQNRPVMLFVGRFVEKKGLDIVEKLARLRTDLDFRLAGQGPMQPAEWGLPNVHLLGHLSAEQLADEYGCADLLLLPSHGEGYPLVVQEAMATGLAPLVSEETAAALPGVSAHVYCAPVARTTPGLVDVWSGLIDQALALEAGCDPRRARLEYVRAHWSWTQCIDSYDRLLHGVVGDQLDDGRRS